MDLEERLPRKGCIAASSPDIAEVAVEEADDHYWLHALNQRARVSWYVMDARNDIEVIDSDALMWVMSQVKWPTPNLSGSTIIDLIDCSATDLLSLNVKNLPSYISIEPLLSFLKDTFSDAR
ncbi:ABC transporter B family member 2 [Hordeum vulgare]|nr:ABC transporter B family member 2 [Hordeum vulgare]